MWLNTGCYSIDSSGLVIKVLHIYHQSEDKVSFKAELCNKYNNIVYETKTYKLLKTRIKNWKKYEKIQ